MFRKSIAKVLLLSILGLFLLPSFSFSNITRPQPVKAAGLLPPTPSPTQSYGIGCVAEGTYSCAQIVFVAYGSAGGDSVKTSLVFLPSGIPSGTDRVLYILQATTSPLIKYMNFTTAEASSKYPQVGTTIPFTYETATATLGLDIDTTNNSAYRLVDSTGGPSPINTKLATAKSTEPFFNYLASSLTSLMSDLNAGPGLVETLDPKDPSLPDFYKNWFSGETGIVLNIVPNQNDDTEAPRILYPPNPNAQASPGTPFARPLLTFRLKQVVEVRGALDNDSNGFYFVCDEKNYSDLAIRVGMQGVEFVKYGDLRAIEDDIAINLGGGVGTLNKDLYLSSVINKVYNGRNDQTMSWVDWLVALGPCVPFAAVCTAAAWEKIAGTVCGNITTYPNTASPAYTKVFRDPLGGLVSDGQIARCLNDTDGGWLKKWGVAINQSSTGNPVYVKPPDLCAKSIVCAGGGNDILCSLNQALCWVAKMFYDWFKLILGDAQKSLMSAIGFKESCN